MTRSPAGPLVSSPVTVNVGAKRRDRFNVMLFSQVNPASSYSMAPWKVKVWTD